MEHLLVTRRGPVATIAFDRPEALNAFTPAMLKSLIDAIGELESDSSIAALILQGEGRAFSAGVDLKVLQGATPIAGRISNAFDDAAQAAASVVRRSPLPVIAKVHGFCFTGALELALHCDFILTTVDTKFGDTHAKWGLRPTWGMSQNLARAVGVRRARELSFTAQAFTGAEAAAWGLANTAVADKAALDALTNKCADQISGMSRGAVSAYKKLYRVHEENRTIEDALSAEISMDFPEITDTAERLKAFGA